jgi:hypothetical protein
MLPPEVPKRKRRAQKGKKHGAAHKGKEVLDLMRSGHQPVKDRFGQKNADSRKSQEHPSVR